ncbi:alpha/beta fold hydrolase [Pararhodospirillum oryzae]|uniref:Esterase n=1 Tax=Pararhodospirillum oryzae TaxID=478448 RepID=A0A512HC67_9PROT|nr:alpha/beta fold hydrolase [Pararhodospirillum oryzae]GEO83031.1 esterase [Pararhodospirillum oryzae]
MTTVPSSPASFVLVHGAWHGGWCWERVAPLLRARGHRVTTPTLTGLGERHHLLAPGITLSVFVADIVNHLIWEDLRDVILVGHSFGGAVISGVADQVPERLRQLVFLDAHLLESDETTFDRMPGPIVTDRLLAAARASGGVSLPVPPARAFAVTDPADVAWLEARLTPHPLDTYRTAMTLQRPLGAGLPVRYIACTDPWYRPLEVSHDRVRAYGWPMEELATGHDAMVTAPQALAECLLASVRS